MNHFNAIALEHRDYRELGTSRYTAMSYLRERQLTMQRLVLEEKPRPGVSVLTLNRPEKRNALNVPMLEALCEAVKRVSETDGQRVLVIRAAGAVFCAGLDLTEAQNPALKEKSGALVREMLSLVYGCPCVTIAAVHGAALAGGGGLVAACDIVLADMDATFGFPEVQRGLVAGLIMTFLRRQLHERHVRELLLLGEIIGAERAAEMGLITRAVPTDMLDEAVERHIDAIFSGAPGAIRDTKALLDALWHHPLSADLDAAQAIHAQMRVSDEAMEGLAAFSERRHPNWNQ